MQQEEALQHTAWQRFALYTTAMYRGCLWEQPRLKGGFFVITFFAETFYGGSCGNGFRSTIRRRPRLGSVVRSRHLAHPRIRGLCHWDVHWAGLTLHRALHDGRPGFRVFLVLSGAACQFGHGVGGFATNSIHSRPLTGNPNPRALCLYTTRHSEKPADSRRPRAPPRRAWALPRPSGGGELGDAASSSTTGGPHAAI